MKTTTKRGPAKTTTTKTNAPPTLLHALETMAFHMGEIMTYRPGPGVEVASVRTGFGLGFGEGCPRVYVEVVIAATDWKDAESWGVWAHCTVNGVAVGNRCGARNALAAAYAPVIAWIAAHEAAVASAAPMAVAS